MADFDLSKFSRHHTAATITDIPFLDLFSVDIKEEVGLITYDDGTSLHRANIVELIGPRKAGKSSAAMAWLLTLLTGDYLGMRASSEDSKVLWVDTEMGENELRKRFRSSLLATDLYKTDIVERLQVLSLRCVTKAQRVEMLAKAVSEFMPDLVILDGIADLVVDFNDPKECFAMLEKLSMLTEANNLCLVALIHKNRSDDNSKGHLGAALDQKAYSIFSVKKDGCIAKVAYVDGRSAPINGFSFAFSEEGVPTATEDKKAEERSKCWADWSEVIKKQLGGKTEELTYTELYKAYMDVRDVKIRTAKSRVSKAEDYGILIKTGEKPETRYTLCFGLVGKSCNESEDDDVL